MTSSKRILFVCPTAAFGSCGVADYTKRLAEACGRVGVECGILALNDNVSLSAPSESALPVWICPGQVGWPERMKIAAESIQRFAPDWISLQFVPYGYHPKGICMGLGPSLAKVSGVARRHLFFHELTLGLHREECLKNRIYGYLQRIALRRLLRYWRPQVVHTHAAPYSAWLAKNGVCVRALPLFGNLPVVAKKAGVHPLFDEAAQSRPGNPQRLLGGFFGTFYSGADNAPFVKKLRTFAKESGNQIVVFLAGRQDPSARERWTELAASSDDQLRWVYLGKLSAEAVSVYFQQLDFGIAATPFALIGKSGSVAAMRDHALPVLVPRNDWTPRIPSLPEQPDDGFFRTSQFSDFVAALNVPREKPEDSVSRVASRFLGDLDIQ